MINWVELLMPLAVILVQAGLIVFLMFKYFPGADAFDYQESWDNKTHE